MGCKTGKGFYTYDADATRHPRTNRRPGRDQPDYYLLDELLTDEDRAIRDRVRAFCDAT